jgi:glycosyltransferase involved in cell wall biosynthesis
MIRVAHAGNYKPGNANGVNQTIAGLAKHLPKENIEVELWNFTPKVAAVRKRQVDNVNIFDLPSNRGRFLNLVFMPRTTRRFLKQRSQEVDLVHLHSVFTPENLWASRLGTPYVVTPNGGYSPRVTKGRNRLLKQVWTLIWERSYLRRARAVHAVSPPEVDDLRTFGVEAPIAFVPNGVESVLLSRRTLRPHEASVWVYLGRLAVDHKGLDLLVKGYASLYERRQGELPPLVLAGPDFRGGKEQLERLIRSLGMAESIRFEGPVFGEHKHVLLAQSQIFVHTSRWEGMPFAALEALALGRPVLVTPQTNLALYVKEYGAGWVVDGTPESIAKGLGLILETSAQDLDAVGSRARSLARDRFSWPISSRQMATVYLEAVE